MLACLPLASCPSPNASLTRRALGGSRTRNIRHLGPASLPRLEYEHKEPPPGADPVLPPALVEPQPCAAASLGNQGSNLDSLASEASVLPAYTIPHRCGWRDSNSQADGFEPSRYTCSRHTRIGGPGRAPPESRTLFSGLRVRCITSHACSAKSHLTACIASRSLGCAAAMVVCADHLAFSDLCQNALPWSAVGGVGAGCSAD